MAYQQITRAQLRALLQARLGALGTTFYRADELNRYVQESLRMWNLLTGFWKTRASLTTTANLHWYALPGTITSGLRVEYNGNPLGPATSLDCLDTGRPFWESESATSGGDVPASIAMWAPAGSSMIAVWPADSAGNNSLIIDGIAQTPILSTDGSFVDIGQEELNHVLDYCEHIAMFKEGGAEFQATGPLFKSFIKGASTRNSMLLKSARFREWLGIDISKSRAPERVGAR